MATIQAGDLIQAAWFQDQDSDGTYTQLSLKDDGTDFEIKRAALVLALLIKATENQGDLKVKGQVEPDADI